MLFLKMILSQSKKRYILTFISILISTVILLFSTTYLSSIEKMISEDIYLKNEEYHLFIDESRFEKIPTNFYKKLEEKFNYVSPSVSKYIEINSETILIVGTELTKMSYINEKKVYEYEIIKSKVENMDHLPEIYLSKKYSDNITTDLIQIEGEYFFIAGQIDYSGSSQDNPQVLTSLDIYSKHFDSSTENSESGITKYIIDEYLIRSSENKADIIKKLMIIYSEDNIEYYFNSSDILLSREMTDFYIIEYFSIFIYLIVGLFSFINIYVAIKLTLIERKNYYSTLSVIGMKLTDLRKMIIMEMIILSFISTILSLIIGVLISSVTIKYIINLPVSFSDFSKLPIIFLITFTIPIVQTVISTRFIKNKHILIY